MSWPPSGVLYRLDGHRAVPCDDLAEWAKYFGGTGRIVKQECVEEVMISTVFLAINHNFRRIGRPVLFETMIFEGPLSQSAQRYCTWDEAEQGHVAMVEAVKIAVAASQSRKLFKTLTAEGGHLDDESESSSSGGNGSDR